MPVTKELVDRINELARKQRSVGLTEEEKQEQAACRREYIDGFKKNLKATLDNIKIVTPEEYERLKKENKECDCGCSCEHGSHDHDHSRGPH